MDRLPIRRLIITGKDTPENFALLLGPRWKTEEHTIEEQRLCIHLEPPPGSPYFTMFAAVDGDVPRPTSLRPLSADEEAKLRKIRDLQAVVRSHLGDRKKVTNEDMVATLSSFGEAWAETLPLYQIAINTMDQGVPTTGYR